MSEINQSSSLNETLQNIEKMFLMTAAVPSSKNATPVLNELINFLERIKVPTEDLIVTYNRYTRSVGSNPALRKVLYNQYTTTLLSTKKQATNLIKGLQALELLMNQEKEEQNNAGEPCSESQPTTESIS